MFAEQADRARMHGKHDRESGAQPLERRRSRDAAADRVLGPVSGQHAELPCPRRACRIATCAEPSRPKRSTRRGHVAGERGTQARPSRPSSAIAVGVGANSRSRDVIGGDPVDFLRHVAVEAAQPRLDMGHRHALLGRDQRAGNRRVRVAVNEHSIRTGFEDHLLELLQHATRLLTVRAGSDAEIDVGPRDLELVEEHVRELGIVVLARVDDQVLDALAGARRIVRGHRPADRRQLHELGPRADDADDAHGSCAAAQRARRPQRSAPAVSRIRDIPERESTGPVAAMSQPVTQVAAEPAHLVQRHFVEVSRRIALVQEVDDPLHLVGDAALHGAEDSLDEIDELARRRLPCRARYRHSQPASSAKCRGR